MKTNLFVALCGGFALGIAMIGAAPAAVAQAAADQASDQAPGGDHPHRGGHGFDTMDANHDGVITLDEWKAAGRPEARFAEIDADHDGKLTRDELRAFMQKMRAEHQQNDGH